MDYQTKYRKEEKQRQPAYGRRPQAASGVSEDLRKQFESMSGYSFDDVRIHYNSGKPAQLKAAAFTVGNEVYLGSGQEKHLGHELGHVLQQKRGHIQSEIEYKGMAINHDPDLEREADVLAQRALGIRIKADSGAGAKASVSGGYRNVAQMAKWQWYAVSGRWKCISGDAVAGPPKHQGKKDGEIYDDQSPLMVTGKKITPPKAPEPFHFDTTYTGDDEQYREAMEVLRDIVLNGGELDKSQQQQMNTYFSNASFYLGILQQMRRMNPEEISRWEEWSEELNEFQANAGLSVFTRDIDSGELKGQPVSGGTMSVVERMKRGFGRIRNYKDLNRGGGGGSYVRFVAERKRRVEGEAPSNTLDVGSLASAGVTVLYDAVSVVRDNDAPAHMAFNKQDSAGRIFGTDAATPEELRRNSRLSSNILSKANPENQFPIPGRNVPDLTEEYIMENAIRGLQEMTRQASEGQSSKEEYNETVLFSGAKISSIKAILIHTPTAPEGGLPVKVVYTPEQIQRQQRRHDLALQLKEDELLAHKIRIRDIDKEVKRLRGTLRSDRSNYNDILGRITALEEEKSALIVRQSEAGRKRVPEVKGFKFLPGKKVSTDVSIRSPYLYEKGQLPEGLQKWSNETGYGGVPMRYLFYHVNPKMVRREELPHMASSIWAEGYDRWQQDIQRETEKRRLEEHAAEDAQNLRVTGMSI